MMEGCGGDPQPALLCSEQRGTHPQKRAEIAACVRPAPAHEEKTNGQKEEWKMPAAEDLSAVWQGDASARQERSIWLERGVETPGLRAPQSPW